MSIVIFFSKALASYVTALFMLAFFLLAIGEGTAVTLPQTKRDRILGGMCIFAILLLAIRGIWA